MRVFVTGGTGFIGAHLCRRLIERGDQVIALVRSKHKAARLPSGVEIFEGDLSTFARPSCVLPDCDVVVHLAGVVAANSLAEYDAVNHVAVRHLVEALSRREEKPKRLVFASSLAAAGPSPAGRAWTEADPPAPIDPYGEAKAKAERVVASAPFPTTSFRPPTVLGPGDEASLTLFRSAKAGIGFRVAGKPMELSFVDVRDLVEAIVLMIDDERPGSFLYFAGHPRPIDVRELWRGLARAVDNKVLVVAIPRAVLFVAMLVSTVFSKIFRFKNQLDEKQYRQMVAPAFVCSSAKLKADLGFAARHDLAETLSNAARGYREAGML
jgi:nucleoside-diphosphate-sugar epimerase